MSRPVRPVSSLPQLRQRIVSGGQDRRLMTDRETLINQLVTGDVTGLRRSVDKGTHTARSTRDRQLLAIARAYLAGSSDLLDALIRDHLTDHPDSRLAAWVTTRTDSRSTQ